MNRAKWHERLEVSGGRRIPTGFVAAGVMGLVVLSAITVAFWFLIIAA